MVTLHFAWYLHVFSIFGHVRRPFCMVFVTFWHFNFSLHGMCQILALQTFMWVSWRFSRLSFRVSFKTSFRASCGVSFRVSFRDSCGVSCRVSFRVSCGVSFRVSFRGSCGVSCRVSFEVHLGFHFGFLYGVIYGFIYDFFRFKVSLGFQVQISLRNSSKFSFEFHARVSYQDFLYFFSRFLNVQVGSLSASLGFHFGFLYGLA